MEQRRILRLCFKCGDKYGPAISARGTCSIWKEKMRRKRNTMGKRNRKKKVRRQRVCMRRIKDKKGEKSPFMLKGEVLLGRLSRLWDKWGGKG